MSEIGLKKKFDRGVGGCCELYPIFIFMSGIVLTLQSPLRIVLFSFVLYCILYVLLMYIFIKSEKKQS